MSEKVGCPACGAPVDVPDSGIAIVCPYCGAQVDGGTVPNLDNVKALIAGKKKIQAIAVYREMTGAGLREAKEAIEALTEESVLDGVSSGSRFSSSADVIDEIKRQLRKGNKIEAIRAHREYFGVGLKEAKEAVEIIESDMKFQPAPVIDDEPPAFARPETPLTEPVISANPFDETKPPAWRNWVIGCSVAFVIFCCLCLILPAVLLMLSGPNGS